MYRAPSGVTLPVGIRITRGNQDFDQIAAAACIDPQNTGGHGMASYFNILFSRYYATMFDATSRVVFDASPALAFNPGSIVPMTQELRFDGTYIESWINQTRVVGPVLVPEYLRSMRRFGFYVGGTINSNLRGFVTDFEIREGITMGGEVQRPDVLDSTFAEDSGSTVNGVTPGGFNPNTDQLFIFASFDGGGTISTPTFCSPVGNQITVSGGIVAKMFTLLTAINPFLNLGGGDAIPVTKTGGTSVCGAVIMFWVRNPNRGIPAVSYTQANSSVGPTVPGPVIPTGGYKRLAVFAAATKGSGGGPTLTAPSGFTTHATSGAGTDENINSIIASKALDVSGPYADQSLGNGAVSPDATSVGGYYLLDPDPSVNQ
jgi:hypothetical protein